MNGKVIAIALVAGCIVIATVALSPTPGPVVATVVVVVGVLMALAIVAGTWQITTTKKAQAALTSSNEYRALAEEYRRLSDMAITAQEHSDLKLGEVTAQLDYLREQNESLQKILKDVE
jgi:xanthosine utilization system XapX-like protein